MSKWTPLALAIVLVFVAFLWASTPSWEVNDITFRNPARMIALVNSENPVTAGRYDTFESPRGTDYQVPAAGPIYLVQFHGTPLASVNAAIHVEIGYGDDAVSNSIAAPTNAVIVWNVAYPSADGLSLPVSVHLEIPAGKYPFIVSTGGNYNISVLAYVP